MCFFVFFQQKALCRLLSKLSVLEKLRDNADETQRQMDRQTEDSRKTERETEELETQLLTLSTSDPHHVRFIVRAFTCTVLSRLL